MNRKRLASAVILITALQSQWAAALGLGEIRLASSLNQPMRAEIPLRDIGDLTPEQILIKLASEEDFARSGTERAYFMTRFNFEVVVDGRGSGKVLVSSQDPVVEPFVDLVVEARWPNGRLFKNYTMLLDLPVFGQSSPAPRVRPQPLPNSNPAATQRRTIQQPVSRPQIRRTSSQAQTSTRPASRPTPAQASRRVVGVIQDKPKIRSIADAPPSNRNVGVRPSNEKYDLPSESGSGQYRVQHYDTLSIVARRYTGNSDISTRQMMLALQRLNPEAFIKGNVNNLKSGYVLKIPSEEEARRFSREQAIAEVERQNRAWRGESVEPSALPSNQINATAEIEREDDEVEYEEAEARLSIAAGGIAEGEGRGDGESKKGSASIDNSMLAEELSRQEEENADLKSRIANLEEQLATLQRMLEIRDDRMASAQATAAQNNQSSEGDASKEGFDENELSAVLEQGEYTEPSVDESEFEGLFEDGESEAEEDALAASLNDSNTESKSSDSNTAISPAESAKPEAMAEGWKGYLQMAKGYFDEAKTTAEGMLGDSDPSLLRYIGIGILVLVLLLVLLLRRGKSKPEEEDELEPEEMSQGLVAGGVVSGSVATGVTAGAASAALDAQEAAEAEAATEVSEHENVAAESEAVEGSDPQSEPEPDSSAELAEGLDEAASTDASMTVESAPQSGDVVAESEIYIAYGRHEDAIKLLESAQVEDPNNAAITAKLAEAYAAGGNQEQLGSLLEKLDPINDADTIEKVKESLPDDPESRAWMEKLAASSAVMAAGAAASSKDEEDLLDISLDDGQEVDLDLDELDLDDIDIEADFDDAESSDEPDDLEQVIDSERQSETDLGMDSVELAKELSLDQDSLNAEMDALDQAAVGAAMDDLNISDLLKDEIEESSKPQDAEAIADTENQLDMVAQGDDLGIEMLTEDFDDTSEKELEALDLGEFDLDDQDLELELDEETLEALNSLDDDKGESEAKKDSESLDTIELELSDSDAESLADFSFDEESISLEIEDPLDLELDDKATADDVELPSISEFDADSFDLQDDQTGAADDADISMLSHDDEAGTKLDLARAYIDMGDGDAAKDLLEEVLGEGSDAQIADAKELISRL